MSYLVTDGLVVVGVYRHRLRAEHRDDLEEGELLATEVQLAESCHVLLDLREGFKDSSSIKKWTRPLIFTPPTH